MWTFAFLYSSNSYLSRFPVEHPWQDVNLIANTKVHLGQG